MLCDLGGILTTTSGGGGATLSGGSGGTVSETDAASPYNTTVGIRFNIDGTIETGKGKDGSVTWSSSGNWITGDTPDNSYSVRFTNLVQITGVGDWTTEAEADDNWIALVTAQRTWLMTVTNGIERHFSCDFEVRKTAGAPPTTAAAAYEFNIINGTL